MSAALAGRRRFPGGAAPGFPCCRPGLRDVAFRRGPANPGLSLLIRRSLPGRGIGASLHLGGLAIPPIRITAFPRAGCFPVPAISLCRVPAGREARAGTVAA
jgi:hypothetical protein